MIDLMNDLTDIFSSCFFFLVLAFSHNLENKTLDKVLLEELI